MKVEVKTDLSDLLLFVWCMLTLALKISQGYDRSIGTKTNNAFRVGIQTHFNSDHMIIFCLVKGFMVLSETNNEW